MSDPHITDLDPQHYANPQYGGKDEHVLDFVKQREAIMGNMAAQMAAAGPEAETKASILEGEVKAGIADQNANYAKGALKREILNSYYNHPLILSDFRSGRGISMPLGQGLGPALIIGSGPTLDEAHDLIRNWKGQIICSTSQAPTILALGKKGFHVVAVDVKTESDELMPLDAWEDADAKLITHPGMDPEIIQVWRWKKYYFRIVVHQMPFYMETIPMVYPMINTSMYVFGCAGSAQISMAAMMGYSPLFLCGLDFGFPENKSRFRAFRRNENKEWVLDPPAGDVKYYRHAKVTYRNGCPSDSFTAYYKQTLFNVWRLSLADIFVVGNKGGLYELPHVSHEEVDKTQGNIRRELYISNKDKKDICERYLLQYGTYTFEYPNGQVEFVVFAGGEDDVPRYIEAINKGFADAKLPGVLNLSEEKSRLGYLRDDKIWQRKESTWHWEIKSPQSPMETIPVASSTNESESTEMTGRIS